MTEKINRRETTHVDKKSGSAHCTAQWLLEMRNLKGKATHPITHNNKLTMFICGMDGFADIAQEVRKAESSIDICCWGFDPGMELERKGEGTWPRGDTYGDLLIAAGRRGVAVRLLVWYDWTAAKAGKARNMPGMTHDTSVWRRDGGLKPHADHISANNSIATLRTAAVAKRAGGAVPKGTPGILYSPAEEDIPLLARKEYCFSWYQAARGGGAEKYRAAPAWRRPRQYRVAAVARIHEAGLYRGRPHGIFRHAPPKAAIDRFRFCRWQESRRLRDGVEFRHRLLGYRCTSVGRSQA